MDKFSEDSIFVLFHFVFHYKLCIILRNIMYYIIKNRAIYNAWTF